MMNNMNSGYQKYSRSFRSVQEIEHYELPLSQINKSVIESYLDDNADLFDIKKLIVVPVNTWKFVAKTFVEASSWHHTSSKLNKTDHYDLYEVASTIEKLGLDFINERMAEKKKRLKSYKKTNSFMPF
jgi:DNA/RNA endonuclease G (NUC1)